MHDPKVMELLAIVLRAPRGELSDEEVLHQTAQVLLQDLWETMVTGIGTACCSESSSLHEMFAIRLEELMGQDRREERRERSNAAWEEHSKAAQEAYVTREIREVPLQRERGYIVLARSSVEQLRFYRATEETPRRLVLTGSWQRPVYLNEGSPLDADLLYDHRETIDEFFQRPGTGERLAATWPRRVTLVAGW